MLNMLGDLNGISYFDTTLISPERFLVVSCPEKK